MKFLFIIDPIESLNTSTDSSFALMLESQKRKHDIFYCELRDLFIEKEKPCAQSKQISVQHSQNYWKLIRENKNELKNFDCIFMRKDPPVDQNYLSATYILERVSQKTLIVNNPASLRNFNEKLSVFYFPDLIPPTLVSAKIEDIFKFQNDVGGNIVIKPVYGHGGDGVYFLSQKDPNKRSLLQALTRNETVSIITQKALPEGVLGDKRIILFNGDPIGAIMRVPKKGDFRANLHVGGSCKKIALTKNDKLICKKVGGFLKKNGVLFAGIDVIGNYLIEINITSPTCLQELDRLNKMNSASILIDIIEEIKN